MAKRRKDQLDDEGLSQKEYLLFYFLFLFLPAACVLVSSILYYVWKKEQPRRANQINILGFCVFGMQAVFYVLFLVFLKE